MFFHDCSFYVDRCAPHVFKQLWFTPSRTAADQISSSALPTTKRVLTLLYVCILLQSVRAPTKTVNKCSCGVNLSNICQKEVKGMYLEINFFVSCFGILVHNNRTSTKYINEKLLLCVSLSAVQQIRASLHKACMIAIKKKPYQSIKPSLLKHISAADKSFEYLLIDCEAHYPSQREKMCNCCVLDYMLPYSLSTAEHKVCKALS